MCIEIHNILHFVVFTSNLQDFYSCYFEKEFELNSFLSDAFDYEHGNLNKRQMLYQVPRFVSLANDIDQIRPKRDSLRIFFIKTCLDN